MIIRERLEEHFKTLLKNNNVPINDLWNSENVLLYFPSLKWNSPVTDDVRGWQPLKKFSGTATLLLANEREFNLDFFMSQFFSPIQIEPKSEAATGSFDVKLKWHFQNQREKITELHVLTELEGALEGILFKKL